MAQEIQQTVGLSCTNGDFKMPKIGGTTRITQTVKGGGVPGQVVAITAVNGTTVSNTGLTAPGVTYIKNTDPTNYVEYGPLDAGTLKKFGKLMPGEEATFRMAAGVSWAIQANTASCKCIVQQLDT